MNNPVSSRTLVLEGLPASGKTSLARLLESKGFSVVNESLGKIDYARARMDQKQIFMETVDKYLNAKRVSPAVIDRGYPSLLAWDYCAERLWGRNDYKEKNEWINQSLANGQIYEPTCYIYMRITPEQSLERRPRVKSDLDIWSDSEGLRHCSDFYENFFSEDHMQKRTLVIDGSIPTEEIFQKLSKEAL